MSQGGFIEENEFPLGLEAKCGSETSRELLGRVFKRRESRPFGLELTEHLLCATCHALPFIFQCCEVGIVILVLKRGNSCCKGDQKDK